MKTQKEYIASISKNAIRASSNSSEDESNADDTLPSLMEDVSPKQPTARQTIVTPARNLGYDPLTFATKRRKFLVHRK